MGVGVRVGLGGRGRAWGRVGWVGGRGGMGVGWG